MGGGDYSLDVSNFGADDSLLVTIPPSNNIQVVASTSSLSYGGVAVRNPESVQKVGEYIEETGSDVVLIGSGGEVGVCAIIIEGKLYARIALHNSSFSVDDCFALPLPLFAYREGEQVQPLSIANGVARWSIYPPSKPTRIVGFNLPTAIEYHADSAESIPMSANGGEFGIEFTTPEDATGIDIFNENFWLYLN